MATETKIEAQAAEAPAAVAKTVAETTAKVVDQAKQAQKKERTRARRKAKRNEAATKTNSPRRAKTVRRARAASPRRPAAARNERIENVTLDTNNWFAGFTNLPGGQPFQNLFAQAGERSQEAVRRSQQIAEQLAELARGNVEALVDAGRIATEGARSIGQDVVAKGREGVEQAADAVRTLAEAKSPTEFIQLQTEIARTSFDRMVAESSRLTESMVKLAGEAIQPLSNRATANAERINQLVA